MTFERANTQTNTIVQFVKDQDMIQENIRNDSQMQHSPVVKCNGKCGNYHEIEYMTLRVPTSDQYYCYNCVMTTTNLREKYNELSGKEHGTRDPVTDPDLNYAHRRRMTDKENKQFNDSWIRAQWRLNR